MNNLTFIAYRPDKTTYCSFSCNCIRDQKGSDFVFEDKRSKEEIIDLLRKYKDYESVRVMYDGTLIIEDNSAAFLWNSEENCEYYEGPLLGLAEQILGLV